ncbi:protein FAM114A2 [Biomphalaria pfeifferi]|uniref:Protein FAM114A2 n=1 Tax=Biomphalaria pfeifferi TaxID=112525 RepID=A0AAD8BU51_BIOPF|nr:protein FAM114A2 [Biomphalaria pfeifferi]
MSESDDETAFASADEGEDKKSKDTSSPKSKEMKSSEIEQKKDIEKKDTGQKKQKQAPKNKKGKGSNQTSTKEARPALKSSPSQSVATSPKPDVASSSNPDISEAKKESSPKPVGTKEDNDLKVGEKTVTESRTPEESRSRARNSLPPESKADPETDKSETLSSNITAQKEPKDAGASEKTTATQVQAESRPNTETQSHDVVKTPEKQDIPRGQVDRSQQQEQILQNLGATAEKSSRGGWGWSSWGSTILSAATNSVQTFTHQVGDGLSTIIDSVESSLGIPDPEDVAKDKSATEAGQSPADTTSAITSQPEETAAVESENVKTQATDKTIDKEPESTEEEEKKDKNNGGGGWFLNWGVSDLAKKVTNTGKSLASKGQTLMSEGFDAVENLAAGGIDVLETIGKKTYNTLSEHDPAFRKTRDFLSPKSNKPNLSSVLREAKDRAEQEAEKVKENEEAMKAHFGTLFDDYQGLAHLEALEMLSNQSEKKVHSLLNSLSSKDLAEIKPLLISIKETFSVQEEDESAADTDQDVSGLVSQCLAQLKLGTASDKLNTVLEMVRQWIADTQENQEKDSIKDVHQKSIQALAELTAKGVEQFHKAGELILLEKNKENDFIEKSQSLARLTSVLCHEIGNLATRFVACLNKMAEKQENPDEITQFVTNIYLEATNSSTYIQDAFVLLLPVVQHAAIEHSVLFRES